MLVRFLGPPIQCEHTIPHSIACNSPVINPGVVTLSPPILVKPILSCAQKFLCANFVEGPIAFDAVGNCSTLQIPANWSWVPDPSRPGNLIQSYLLPAKPSTPKVTAVNIQAQPQQNSCRVVAAPNGGVALVPKKKVSVLVWSLLGLAGVAVYFLTRSA